MTIYWTDKNDTVLLKLRAECKSFNLKMQGLACFLDLWVNN